MSRSLGPFNALLIDWSRMNYADAGTWPSGSPAELLTAASGHEKQGFEIQLFRKII